MAFIEITKILFFWGAITIVGFWLISKFKGERTSFVGGCAFLCIGVVVPMLLSAYLNNYLTCAITACETAKIQSQALIGLFSISWASIGANLLAAVLSHK